MLHSVAARRDVGVKNIDSAKRAREYRTKDTDIFNTIVSMFHVCGNCNNLQIYLFEFELFAKL